jgi:hypothetical protein
MACGGAQSEPKMNKRSHLCRMSRTQQNSRPVVYLLSTSTRRSTPADARSWLGGTIGLPHD